ncbi:MAG: hypothetical protein CMK89_06525, partial [Pseudomonadales bacterium]|nr:hypothetical protein [Pseudomonadales bacterium]
NGLAKANLHGANDQKVLAGGDRESVGAGFTDSGFFHQCVDLVHAGTNAIGVERYELHFFLTWGFSIRAIVYQHSLGLSLTIRRHYNVQRHTSEITLNESHTKKN